MQPPLSDDQITQDRPNPPLLAELLARQRLLWQRGERVRVEHLLEQDGVPLLQQPEALLDLIYNEMVLREEHGDPPRLDEYVSRFPHLAAQLALQFRIDPGIEILPAPHGLEKKRAVPAFARPARVPTTWTFTGYELLEELGRGGMGVVYKARQLGLNRLVALKMVLADAGTDPRRLGRFRTEAEAAARLQHPNIVQVYEVGEQEGWLFFSLELVEGGSLAEHIGGTPQPPGPSAELVETLARTMHVVHQAGVVHRDLKPANILLQPRATKNTKSHKKEAEDRQGGVGSGFRDFSCFSWPFFPKITDFGLAKLLDEDVNRTKTGTSLGTPRYMAPEQTSAGTQPVSPAVDVYALGTILYELLTGQPPFNGATPLDTLEQVRTREPVPPSRLQPKVPRELETICLKCLEKEPYRRYATAEALADDLRRFRDGKSVLARPASAWERGRKWARRHPTLAAVAAGVGLAVLAALGGIVWHDVRVERALDSERRNFREARAALEQLIDQVSTTDLAELPQLEPKRQEWLRSALQYYQKFLQECGADPALRVEAAQADAQLGDIQDLLGQLAEAQASYEAAIALQRPSGEAARAPADARRDLARSYQGLGKVLKERNQFDEAEEAYRHALRLRERLAEEAPDRPDDQRQLAAVRYSLGALLARLKGRTPEAAQAYQQALAVQERLAAAHPDRPEYRRDQARTLNNLGILLKATSRADAEDRFRQAIELQKPLAEADGALPGVRQELARSYSNLGVCLEETGADLGSRDAAAAREAYGRARGAYNEARELLIALVKTYPLAPAYQNELAAVYANEAGLLVKMGQPEAAGQAYQYAIDVRKQLVERSHGVPGYERELALAYRALGSFQNQQGRPREAEEAYGEALALQEKLASAYPGVPDYRNELGLTLNGLARLSVREKDVPAARRWLDRAIAAHEAAVKATPRHHNYRQLLRNDYAVLASLALDEGNYREAADTAAKLAEVFPADWQAERREEDVRAAEVLARCVPLAGGNSDQPEAERRRLADEYAGRSVDLLRDAMRLGFRGAAELRKVAAYEALRDRPDFQQLLRDMDEKAKEPAA
jgi:serine/threonine protein kinase/tetratricopeptide (TPR) repeat protein